MNSPQQRDELRKEVINKISSIRKTLQNRIPEVGIGEALDLMEEEVAWLIQSQIDSAVKEAEARPFINLDNGFYELNAMQITVGRDKLGNKTVKYMIPYATEQFLLQQSKQEGK